MLFSKHCHIREQHDVDSFGFNNLSLLFAVDVPRLVLLNPIILNCGLRDFSSHRYQQSGKEYWNLELSLESFE